MKNATCGIKKIRRCCRTGEWEDEYKSCNHLNRGRLDANYGGINKWNFHHNSSRLSQIGGGYVSTVPLCPWVNSHLPTPTLTGRIGGCFALSTGDRLAAASSASRTWKSQIQGLHFLVQNYWIRT